MDMTLQDPNIDPATGEIWGGQAPDPSLSASGDTWVNPVDVYNPPDSSFPVVFSDPGANYGGSITESSGQSAPGGSGFGTFLSSFGSFAGGILRGTGIYNPGVSGPANTAGVTAAGLPCQIGQAGCQPTLSASQQASKNQTTMLVMVGVGALVLIIILRR